MRNYTGVVKIVNYIRKVGATEPNQAIKRHSFGPFSVGKTEKKITIILSRFCTQITSLQRL